MQLLSKQRPQSGQQRGITKQLRDFTRKPKRLSTGKTFRVLSHFKQGQSLNAIEAAQAPLFDRYLHSTVSSLENKGYRFKRHWERVWREDCQEWTELKRYWLDTSK